MGCAVVARDGCAGEISDAELSGSEVSAGNMITGIGAVSCLGRGQQALWRGLAEGRDGLRPIRRFSTDGFRVQIGGLVPERETSGASAPALCLEFAGWAAREAWEDSGWHERSIAPERVALVLGTSPSDQELAAHEISERLGDELGIRGPRITVSTACSSSTNALGIAAELLDAGLSDVVLAGGADVLTPLLFAGFHALGVLSVEKCAPFSFPHGTSLGEGAGFVVLERARWRSPLRSRARLLGYGLSCDAFHDTGPDPTGAGVARAVLGALRQAALPPDRVGYVNAHGTGTSANDPAEWRALQKVFGERARQLPVSSSKSMLGHAQAAAGVLELCATILAMERGCLPQTLHFTRPRQHAPADPVSCSAPRACAYRYAVSMNSAFGGANAALVVGAPRAAAQEDDRAPESEPGAPTTAARAVYVAGVAALGAHGTSALALARHLDDGVPLPLGAPPSRAFDGVAWPADPQRLDPSTRYLLGAATLALEDAGLRRLTGPLADRAGCIAGITRISPQCIDEIQRSIEERGMARLSAHGFSRMVLNAPLGSCAKALSLRGPASTVSIGPGSGLFALVYAARWLATRRDTALMLGAGVDEHDARGRDEEASSATAGTSCPKFVPGSPPPLRYEGRVEPGPMGHSALGPSSTLGDSANPRARGASVPAGADGAACVVLSPEAAPGRPRLAGYGIAGPGGYRIAVEQALVGAGVRMSDVGVCIGPRGAVDPRSPLAPPRLDIDPASVFGGSQSFASAASVVAAVLWLRSGRARHALIIGGGGSASVAALLSAAPDDATISPGASEGATCTTKGAAV